MTAVLKYDPSALAWDLARGLAGVAVTLGPLVLVETILRPVEILLWVLLAIFAFYLAKTAQRLKTEIRLDNTGLHRRTPFGRASIPWEGMERVRLSYFASSRTKPGAGIAALRVSGRNRDGIKTKIIVESSLTGFDKVLKSVAAMSAEGAAKGAVQIDETSRHNFNALGVAIPAALETGSS